MHREAGQKYFQKGPDAGRESGSAQVRVQTQLPGQNGQQVAEWLVHHDHWAPAPSQVGEGQNCPPSMTAGKSGLLSETCRLLDAGASIQTYKPAPAEGTSSTPPPPALPADQDLELSHSCFRSPPPTWSSWGAGLGLRRCRGWSLEPVQR